MNSYNVSVPIRVPTTPNDWQLFSEEPGAAGAARKMTAALKRSFRVLDDATKQGHTLDNALVYTCFEDLRIAAQALVNWGATDTEPRNVACNAMQRYIKHRYGKDMWIECW